MAERFDVDGTAQAIAEVEELAGASGEGGDGREEFEVPAAEEDSTERLLDELTLESEKRGSAYTYNRRLAETGRWVRWPQLGPHAYLLIAKTQNSSYVELWDKAVEKFGGKDGKIKLRKRLELLPVINGKTILRGIRGIRVSLAAAEQRVFDLVAGAEIATTIPATDQGTGREVELGITHGDAASQPEVPGAEPLPVGPWLDNSLTNRVNLLRALAPDLGQDVFTYANDGGHYGDAAPDEEIRGN